jgi:hypothetical protein
MEKGDVLGDQSFWIDVSVVNKWQMQKKIKMARSHTLRYVSEENNRVDETSLTIK